MSQVGENIDEKFVVDRYLDQVKILTALATTLLISPNLILSLHEKSNNSNDQIMMWLMSANISFIITILLTYFIYSSIVGNLVKGSYDIYRPATRAFSLAQFFTLIWGSISLLILFYLIS